MFDPKFPLLELLPEAERAEVLAGLKMQKYETGQVVYEREGPCMDVFFIFEGRIRIDFQDMSGEVAYFEDRLPGWYIGWYSAISEQPQPVTATAAEKSLLGRMPGPEFMAMLRMRPALCLYMLRMVTERLRSDTKRISHLIVLDALRRVAADIVERAAGAAVVEVPERVDWAARLGMTRETLANKVSELRRRGLISVEGNRVEILQREQLSDLVG